MEKLWRLNYEEQLSLMNILTDLDYDSQAPSDKNIYWVTFYSYVGSHTDKSIDNLKNFVDALLQKMNMAQVKVLTVTVVFNRIGSVTQQYHIDYHPNVESLFIPLIDLNPDNSTQFLEFDNEDDQKNIHTFVDRMGNIPSLEVIPKDISYRLVQICCPAFQVLYLKAGVIHRGITNTGKMDRPMLCIHFTTNLDLTLDESELKSIVTAKYD